MVNGLQVIINNRPCRQIRTILTGNLKAIILMDATAQSICPCIFALDPSEGDCKGLAAWHIGKGHFTIGSNDDRNSNSNNDNTSINLANFNIILAVHTPGHILPGPK
jgi:hypothetical protein